MDKFSEDRDTECSRPRKVARKSPLLAYYRPALSFREIKLEKSVADCWGPPSCADALDDDETPAVTKHYSMHVDSTPNLYISNQTRILRFTHAGACTILCDGLEPHHIIPNCMTDGEVVILRKDKLKLLKVSGQTGETEVIIERQPCSPLCGPDVYIDKMGAVSVAHHPVPQKLELLSGDKCKVNRGQVRASVEGGRGKVVSFDANSYLTAGPDGYIYFSSRTCIYRWDPEEKVVESVAGHPKLPGQRDGFGADARFTHLKRPVLTKEHAYVRENDNRFCRIDLKTFEVRTLELRGIDFRTITTYGIMKEGNRMFVLCGDPFRIYEATTCDVAASTFTKDMESIDWSRSTPSGLDTRNPVDLKAEDDVVLRVDGRVLMARSPYFRRLLSPESNFREGQQSSENEPIVLRGVSSRALRSVLHYIHTDAFEPVSKEELERIAEDKVNDWAMFALDVQKLADRFLIPRLQKLCEMFIVASIRPATVLSVWCAIHENSMTGKGLILEKAIAQYVEDNWTTIRDGYPETLRMVVERQGQLALQLLLSAQSMRCVVAPECEENEGCA